MVDAIVTAAVTLPAALDLMRRPFEADDEGYVVSTWLHDYVDDILLRDDPLRPLFYDDYRPYVEARLGTVEIACLRDEPNVIVGWRCEREGVLHFAHVKPRFRGVGVFRWLVGPLLNKPMLYTHETRGFARMKLNPRWQYRPLLKWR